MRKVWLLAFGSWIGCSSPESLPPPEVVLLVGQENETWKADPAPTRVQIELVEADRRRVIGEANAPATKVTIKDPGITSGTIASLEATAMSADGTPLVRGATVPFVIYDFFGVSIPIFIARAPSWSRPPENLEHGRTYPVTAIAWHEFVISAGGTVKDVSPATPDIYDGMTWESLQGEKAFARAPKSMVWVAPKLLSIDETGATEMEYTPDGGRIDTDRSPPAGLTYAEVAGGDVYDLADGSSYVIGATRTSGDPTSKVLRVDKNGAQKTVTLAVPRLGAAAGVVNGNLVVWGGSSEGPGAEVLNKTEDAFNPLPFPSDATASLGLGTFDGNTALLGGGKDPMSGAAASFRVFDITCTADCAASELAIPPVGLQRTRIFPLAAGNVLVTGESDDGEFHAFTLVTSSGTPEITERPLRERRKGATALVLPNGLPGVLGGENPETGAPALSIESFFF